MRPGIIAVTLSAYGHAGPWAGRRGFDSLVQNASGINVAEAEAAGVPATQGADAGTERGRLLSQACQACHSLEAGGSHLVGPNLAGIFGRPAGTAAGFSNYSPALLRSGITGHPFLSEVAPITGPMYQLYIFFMITDPKTTVRSYRGQCLVACLVAAFEAVLRLMEFVHAPYYALFVIGPAANLVEIAANRRRVDGSVPVPASAR